METLQLTIAEKIDRARREEGRTQKYIIAKMVENGFEMSDSLFSTKKKYSAFTKAELSTISNILKTKF